MAPDNPMTTPGIIWRSDDLTTPIEGWRGTLEIRAGSAVDSTTGPLAELARLRAENERLKAALKPVTRDQINEAVIEVMAQAQSFASSWSLVGGRYDSGDMLDHAHKQKSELERMVRAAIDAAMASGKV